MSILLGCSNCGEGVMAAIADRLQSAAEADVLTEAAVGTVLDNIRENILDGEKKISRRMIVVAALFGLFELTKQSGIVQFSAFGILLTDTNIVLLCVPVIISYLYLAMGCGVSKIKILEEAYAGLFRAIYPNLYGAGCMDYTLPLHRARLYSIVKEGQAGINRSISNVSIYSIFATTVLVPPIVVVYMFIVYVEKVGFGLINATAAFLSVICIIPVPLLLYETLKAIGLKTLIGSPVR